MADDLAELAARFGAALRLAGLPAGPGRCERFAAAVTLARPQTQRSLYLCALATLVSSKAHAELLEAVFSQVFGGLADPADQRGDPNPGAMSGRAQRTPEDLLAQAARAARTHASGARPGPPQALAGTALAGTAEPGGRTGARLSTGTWAAAPSGWRPRISLSCPRLNCCSWPP